MHISDSKLASVVDRFEQIEARMGVTTESSEIVQLGKDYAELKPVADGVRKLQAVREEMSELEAMLDDPEMGPIAKPELQSLKDSLPEIEHEVALLLLPKDRDDNASIVLEIRAGTGGDEAAIFAGDLFRMYSRFASLQGWKVEIENESEADQGGYKEIMPEDIDINFSMGDVRVDTMRASGAGGQHVNKTDSAVRMTHEPSGIVVVCDAKSQHQNRANAERILKMRLYDMERERLDAERAGDRKAQLGSGDRSERIRTYNYPQGRVSDHRINLTLYNLDKIIAGDALNEVVDALIAEDQADRLADMANDL